MRRALFVLAVLGGLCWLGRPAVADESGLRLAVTPSKASYAPGEAVSLTVSVTNRTGVGCRLATDRKSVV